MHSLIVLSSVLHIKTSISPSISPHPGWWHTLFTISRQEEAGVGSRTGVVYSVPLCLICRNREILEIVFSLPPSSSSSYHRSPLFCEFCILKETHHSGGDGSAPPPPHLHHLCPSLCTRHFSPLRGRATNIFVVPGTRAKRKTSYLVNTTWSSGKTFKT